MRLRPKSAFVSVHGDQRSGYTLVEILVATTLTLILMTAVVTVFGGVGDGIAKSRRAMEQFDRLRTAVQQLAQDLKGVTVKLDGRPARPEENQGYLEIIEGGILNSPVAVNTDDPTKLAKPPQDLSVGQRGDILMFTTRNAARPFVGRYQLSGDPNNLTMQSDVAEVAWFLRGKTLHRRVLLVAPGVAPAILGLGNQNTRKSFYANNDISVRLVKDQLFPNSLADLTKRENRFAHPMTAYPFDARVWGVLGLPTLAECTSSWMTNTNWTCGSTPFKPIAAAKIDQRGIDMWDRSTDDKLNVSSVLPDQFLGTGGTRVADDVVLTNVIGFDIKVWDPGYNYGVGGYVDLGYQANPPFAGGSTPIDIQNYSFPQGPTVSRFHHPGIYALRGTAVPYYRSSLVASPQTFLPRVYDSGCFSYENEGIYHFDQYGYIQGVDVPGGRATNGLDDPVPPANNPNGPPVANGIVDDVSEQITSSPYPVALRGIQIKIRCYEPDSRQIREITLEHDFLPK
jgi:type II secretory pathway component PulJ